MTNDLQIETRAVNTVVPETHHQPRGPVLLGAEDPRTISVEQFESSPEIVLHGCAKPFTFSQEYDYRSGEYFTESDGSQTLGEGFYTTMDIGDAENYSRVRQLNKSVHPIVIRLLPFRARMLDLRSMVDHTRNAPVPRELFEKWRAYFTDYYKSSQQENLPWWIRGLEGEYLVYLGSVSKLDTIDIRVMLETAPAPKVNSRNLPSPPWMRLFSNFMQTEGYDGLIYNEGGEGINRKEGISYVFYNLKAIGTYEAWHNTRNPLETIADSKR